jgi:hypothetical protein
MCGCVLPEPELRALFYILRSKWAGARRKSRPCTAPKYMGQIDLGNILHNLHKSSVLTFSFAIAESICVTLFKSCSQGFRNILLFETMRARMWAVSLPLVAIRLGDKSQVAVKLLMRFG